MHSFLYVSIFVFISVFLWTNISSPTYPDSYKTTEYKEYLITVTCGYIVLLSFTYFDTEQNFDLVTVIIYVIYI
jgi:hypothetical protein